MKTKEADIISNGKYEELLLDASGKRTKFGYPNFESRGVNQRICAACGAGNKQKNIYDQAVGDRQGQTVGEAGDRQALEEVETGDSQEQEPEAGNQNRPATGSNQPELSGKLTVNARSIFGLKF